MRKISLLIVSLIFILATIFGGISQVFGSSESLDLAQSAQNRGVLAPDVDQLYLPLIFFKPPYRSMFGVEMHIIDEENGLNEVADAKVTWVRKNALKWSQIEQSPGVYTWNVPELDAMLENAAHKYMQTILLIRSTPDWAQLYPGLACGPMAEQYFDEFANFMREVVKRYSAHPYYIDYYEIWNEPDAPLSPGTPDNIYGCWYDSSDTDFAGKHYGNMLKAVYPAVKQANPDAQLLVGGLLLDCDPTNPPAGKDCEPARFLEYVLSAGAGSSFDGVSFHAYDFNSSSDQFGEYSNSNWHAAWNTTGPVVVAKASYLRNLLDSYGLTNKYLLNTEEAVICYDNDTYCQSDDFQETKAIYAVQSYVMAFAQNLRANIWYSVFGWRYSGLLNQNLDPYPVYHSYSFTSHMLRDTKSWQQLNLDAGLFAYELQLPAKRVWVVWSKDGGDHLVNLGGVPDAAWEWNSASDMYVSAAPQQSVTIGVAPIFVEWIP